MYITALDLGSSHIKGVVAEQRKDGSLVVVKAVVKESRGIKKGEILYPEETVKSLFEVLSDIKHFDKKCLKNLVVGISGIKTRFHLSRAAVSIPRPDFEIIPEDVDRVIQESMAVNLPTGWQIIHSFPREFIIDDIEVDDTNVVGLSGKKLEANVVLISAFSSIYKNFLKVAQLVLGKKSDFNGSVIFTPLACERAVLTKSQKELGVVVIDIGFGTTSVVVYQDGKMLMARVLPVGAGNITNDLAIGLKCSIEAAESIKLAHGCASAREISQKDKIDLSQYQEGLNAQISRKFIAEIIEVRVREIFSLVNAELKALGRAGKLPAGAVITGGGARMTGIADIARDELRFPAQIGFPHVKEFEIANMHVTDEIDSPEMAAACGLLLSHADLARKGDSKFGLSSKSPYNLSEPWIKRFVKTLMASD
jgi:cell division protein FtsA